LATPPRVWRLRFYALDGVVKTVCLLIGLLWLMLRAELALG
jgi:hypothetical protein